MDIIYKRISVDNFNRGVYGNKLRQWDTLKELNKSNFVYPIVLRYNNPLGLGGGPCIYHFHKIHMSYALSTIESLGFNPNYVYFNEGSPDHLATFQGEVIKLNSGEYILFYNTKQMHMREALNEKNSPRIKIGYLNVIQMLKHYFSPSSYEDLNLLFEEYPEHSIEFTCFSKYVGDLKGRNALIWEIRKY